MAYSGRFTPKSPNKYKGNPTNIIWRSTWELRFLKYLDTNPAILEYGSEEIVVPYISPLDGKAHRYFVDFHFIVRTKEGIDKKYLVEVKPYSQTIEPKRPKNITESYISSVHTYLVNQAKWKYAKEFAKKAGMEFIILTEKELFNK
jgi:hypothetical protein